jgi:hypothetical protein
LRWRCQGMMVEQISHASVRSRAADSRANISLV